MNPFMASTTHCCQIAEAFSTDASISFVMYLCCMSPSAFPASIPSAFQNRPAFGLPSPRFSVSSVCSLIHSLSSKMGFKCSRTPLPLLLKIVAYLMGAFKENSDPNKLQEPFSFKKLLDFTAFSGSGAVRKPNYRCQFRDF